MDVAARFKWRQVNPKGQLKPTNYRFLCSATLVGQYIWVIGGTHKSFSRTFSLLDLNAQTWSNVVPENNSTYVYKSHTATLFEDSLLIYGVATDSLGTFNRVGEVISFNPLLNEVRVVPTFDNPKMPPYRYEHTAEILEARKLLVVFGGIPKVNSRQLYLLDLFSRTWSRPQEKGTIPSFRRKHGSCLVGSRLFVYSGKPGNDGKADIYTVDIIRRDVVHWQHVAVHGDLGCERLGAAIHYVGGGRIFVFGGFEYSIRSNSQELFVLDNITSNLPICRLVRARGSSQFGFSYTGLTPSARESSKFIGTPNKLILLGGTAYDNSSYFELTPE